MRDRAIEQARYFAAQARRIRAFQHELTAARKFREMLLRDITNTRAIAQQVQARGAKSWQLQASF